MAHSPGHRPDPFQLLRDRVAAIARILKLDDEFLHRMKELTAEVEKGLDWWISKLRLSRDQREEAASPPRKPPVGATLDQSDSESAEPPAVA